MIKLIDIDERNWIDVLFMTTNENGKHIYRKIGFKDTGELVDGEELFRFEF